MTSWKGEGGNVYIVLKMMSMIETVSSEVVSVDDDRDWFLDDDWFWYVHWDFLMDDDWVRLRYRVWYFNGVGYFDRDWDRVWYWFFNGVWYWFFYRNWVRFRDVDRVWFVDMDWDWVRDWVWDFLHDVDWVGLRDGDSDLFGHSDVLVDVGTQIDRAVVAPVEAPVASVVETEAFIENSTLLSLLPFLFRPDGGES